MPGGGGLAGAVRRVSQGVLPTEQGPGPMVPGGTGGGLSGQPGTLDSNQPTIGTGAGGQVDPMEQFQNSPFFQILADQIPEIQRQTDRVSASRGLLGSGARLSELDRRAQQFGNQQLGSFLSGLSQKSHL